MKKQPRIVMLDIETSPITGYTWGMYEQNVLAVLEPSKIICAAWKELNDKSVTCKALPDYPRYAGGVLDDSRLVRELWTVLNEADVVVAHNGDSFDIKKLNARFIYYGLGAPSAYKTVDTRKVAKKHFRFDNNKLDELGHYLEVGRKAPTGGFDLWLGCIDGDQASWNKMKKYNVQDVALLQKVYLKLRPFMDNHPNMNLLAEGKYGPVEPGHHCPSCRSANVTRRGFSITRTGRYQRYQCNECAAWSSGPHQRAKGVALR